MDFGFDIAVMTVSAVQHPEEESVPLMDAFSCTSDTGAGARDNGSPVFIAEQGIAFPAEFVLSAI